MYTSAENVARREASKLWDGSGTVKFLDLATKEEMYGHARLFSHITLEPGCGIGYHIHEHETEFYYMLKGEAVMNDNGTEVLLHPGDTAATGNGAGHGIENRSNETVEFMALIVLE